ncbi:MAG: hypothetical protein Q8S44_03000 [Flavobacteriaceae bacterium]|nr:hypothetical protein [Flavobacteriaceae bacterium]
MIKQLIFIGVVLLYSCNQNPKTVDDKVKKDTISVVQKTHTKTIFLSDDARKEILDLKYFEEFEKIMDRFYNSNPEEIKLNSADLNEVLVRLKDSITIDKINRPDVKARFNILYNESLRLLDMSSISTITQDEIENKIENIIYAYESIITKINQVYLMNINEKNVDVQFQTPKVLIDSIPKEVKIPPQKLNKIKKQQ